MVKEWLQVRGSARRDANWELNYVVLCGGGWRSARPRPKGKKTRISSCFSTIFYQLQSAVPKVRTVIWNFCLKTLTTCPKILSFLLRGIIFTFMLKTRVIFHKIRRFHFPLYPNSKLWPHSHIHSCTILKTVNNISFIYIYCMGMNIQH